MFGGIHPNVRTPINTAFHCEMEAWGQYYRKMAAASRATRHLSLPCVHIQLPMRGVGVGICKHMCLDLCVGVCMHESTYVPRHFGMYVCVYLHIPGVCVRACFGHICTGTNDGLCVDWICTPLHFWIHACACACACTCLSMYERGCVSPQHVCVWLPSCLRMHACVRMSVNMSISACRPLAKRNLCIHIESVLVCLHVDSCTTVYNFMCLCACADVFVHMLMYADVKG